MNNETVAMSRADLRKLLFWAGYGLAKAVSGSQAEETVELVWQLAQRYRIQIQKPVLGKYT